MPPGLPLPTGTAAPPDLLRVCPGQIIDAHMDEQPGDQLTTMCKM